MEWRDIKSAPRDGTEILVYWPYWRADRATIAWFESFGGWMGDCCLSEFHEVASPDRQPTHWMPLPLPPTAPQEDGNGA